MMIKGVTLKSRLDFIRHEYGEEGLQKLLPHLKEEARELFANPKRIRATSWYEFDIQVDLDQALCKYLAGGDEGIYRKMGGWSAEFQEAHAALTDFREPLKFLQMHSVIFGRFFEPGRMEVEMVGPTEAYMRIYEFRSVKENCETNMGFLTRSLEIIGASNIKVKETQCTEDPGVPFCEYHIIWEEEKE
jgi:hypothetical protein